MKRKQIIKREKFGFVEMIMMLRGRRSGRDENDRMENKKKGTRTKYLILNIIKYLKSDFKEDLNIRNEGEQMLVVVVAKQKEDRAAQDEGKEDGRDNEDGQKNKSKRRKGKLEKNWN